MRQLPRAQDKTSRPSPSQPHLTNRGDGGSYLCGQENGICGTYVERDRCYAEEEVITIVVTWCAPIVKRLVSEAYNDRGVCKLWIRYMTVFPMLEMPNMSDMDIQRPFL